MARMNICLVSAAIALLISGCASHEPNAGRYSIKQDKAPDIARDLSQVTDAIPVYEPYSAGGNRDYRLKGNSYSIIKEPKGFSQTGYASWYGEKFHGHATSNGEIYDMYAMTAAHKRLPLPSYVKVTNLENNKQTIVRVNDRGPFHQGRIIDLSYAAAHRLGILANGTARVRLDVITLPPPWEQSRPLLPASKTETTTVQMKDSPEADKGHAPSPSGTAAGNYIQVVATSDSQRASLIEQRLASLLEVSSRTLEEGQVYKVQLGPLDNDAITTKLLEFLRQGEFSGAFRVNYP